LKIGEDSRAEGFSLFPLGRSRFCTGDLLSQPNMHASLLVWTLRECFS
jgi:hypothetical protein